MNMNSVTGLSEKRQKTDSESIERPLNLVSSLVSSELTFSGKRKIKFEKIKIYCQAISDAFDAEKKYSKEFLESTNWLDLNEKEFFKISNDRYFDPVYTNNSGGVVLNSLEIIVKISLERRKLTGLYISIYP
jgi:hypothetical protein